MATIRTLGARSVELRCRILSTSLNGKSSSLGSSALQKKLVLGTGSGRCGTLSLTRLFGRQANATFTHEMRPLLPWLTQQPEEVIRARVNRLLNDYQGDLVGDVASYYLPYLEAALRLELPLKVVCLKRDKRETIESFYRWTHIVHHLPMNHWSEEPAEGSFHDPVWTQIFPQYSEPDCKQAIGKYWDEFYEIAGKLAKTFPESFRIFESPDVLNDRDMLSEMLDFAGIERDQQVLDLNIHTHASKKVEHLRHRQRRSRIDGTPDTCVVLIPNLDLVSPKCEAGVRQLQKAGYEVRGESSENDQPKSLNQMVTRGLQEGFLEFLIIDPDVGFSLESVKSIRRHGLPIATGVCAKPGARAIDCELAFEKSQVTFGAEGGLVEVALCKRNFLYVQRQVFSAIQQAFALPLCDDFPGQNASVPYFQPHPVDHQDGYRFLDETEAFVWRARQCGFKILADTTIRLWKRGVYGYSWEDAGQEFPRYGTFHLDLSQGLQ